MSHVYHTQQQDLPTQSHNKEYFRLGKQQRVTYDDDDYNSMPLAW